MIKVLLISAGVNFGGIEKLELEYKKYLNSDDFRVDILVSNKNTFEKYKIDTDKKYGIFNLNMSSFNRKNQWQYDYKLFKFLKNNKYDIVHINSAVFFYSFKVSLIAKLCGIKNIIVHSHNEIRPNIKKRALITILNPIYRSIITEYLACSKAAQKSLFTKSFIRKNKIKVLKNGIEVDEYKFNETVRKKYRMDLKIEGKTVYGHIGRFAPQKNHEYLIDLFYKIQQKQENSVLLLIGEGPLKGKIEDKVKNLNIADKVVFLGFRTDVDKLLNAMDVFLLPSLYEGLPVVLIEAQTNGLISFCSTNITKEASISNKLKYFTLDDEIDNIAKTIVLQKNNVESRFDAYKDTISNGYDISEACKELKKIYLKVI